MPEMMKLFGSTKNKTTKNEHGENLPHVEITEVVLVHTNISNIDYQHTSGVLYTFPPNTSFGQLLDISSTKLSKTFSSKFLYIHVWFTNQISKPLDIKNKIIITLVIK